MADVPKKKGWIKKATENSHGQFRKKAEAAGESTREFAEDKRGEAGKTGAQARLALNLMHASGADRSARRAKTYDHPRSRSVQK